MNNVVVRDTDFFRPVRIMIVSAAASVVKQMLLEFEKSIVTLKTICGFGSINLAVLSKTRFSFELTLDSFLSLHGTCIAGKPSLSRIIKEVKE